MSSYVVPKTGFYIPSWPVMLFGTVLMILNLANQHLVCMYSQSTMTTEAFMAIHNFKSMRKFLIKSSKGKVFKVNSSNSNKKMKK